MSVSILRSTIKTQLESVTGIGKVYDYERRANSRSRMNSLFVKNNKIDAWVISWRSSEFSFDTDVTGYTALREFLLEGYYSLNDNDASDKIFDNICELVEDKFANLRTLGSGLYKIHEMRILNDDAEFMGVLCHRCRITMFIKEMKNYD